MDLKDITSIAASGLAAQRARLATTASNLANAETTRTPEGGAYRRRDPVFRTHAAGEPFGDRLTRAVQRVDVARIATDRREPISRFDPGHPDADSEGFVELPRVDVVEEMANMMSASRSYEANLVVLRKLRAITEAALRIGR